MFVADWMTKKVVTIGPGDSIGTAVHLMQEKGIKHLVVVEGPEVRGVLSDRDVKAYSPSKATALDIFELHYLLAKAQVRDAMTTKIITSSPDTPVEEAALTMLERNIGCLPILEVGRLVGIISDRDIFRSLVDISGVRHGGHRICVTIEDRPGTVRDVADVVRRLGFRLRAILTSYEGVPKGLRRVVIRTTMEGDFEALRSVLEATYRDVLIQKG